MYRESSLVYHRSGFQHSLGTETTLATFVGNWIEGVYMYWYLWTTQSLLVLSVMAIFWMRLWFAEILVIPEE